MCGVQASKKWCKPPSPLSFRAHTSRGALSDPPSKFTLLHYLSFEVNSMQWYFLWHTKTGFLPSRQSFLRAMAHEVGKMYHSLTLTHWLQVFFVFLITLCVIPSCYQFYKIPTTWAWRITTTLFRVITPHLAYFPTTWYWPITTTREPDQREFGYRKLYLAYRVFVEQKHALRKVISISFPLLDIDG